MTPAIRPDDATDRKSAHAKASPIVPDGATITLLLGERLASIAAQTASSIIQVMTRVEILRWTAVPKAPATRAATTKAFTAVKAESTFADESINESKGENELRVYPAVSPPRRETAMATER